MICKLITALQKFLYNKRNYLPVIEKLESKMKNSCKTEAREDLRSSALTQREKHLTSRE
jgi:hypothetical protein